MVSNAMLLRHSYVLEAANFLSVLTGDPFYVDRHPEAYARWSDRLSQTAREALKTAVSIRGSAMLGPSISYALSAVPGFADMDPGELLGNTDRIEQHLGALPGHSGDYLRRVRTLCAVLAPVVKELGELGFPTYWTSERLPLIGRATEALGQFLATMPADLGEEILQMRGDRDRSQNAPIEVFVCSFAAPHGIKICGDRFITDVRYTPEDTVRIAVHEMFHPPYRLADVKPETEGLIADPLFQESFRTKDPKYGYETEIGFLEENVVEAMELFVSSRLGLVADPIGNLAHHDEGSHKLSVVLLKYFHHVPKRSDESFGVYFRRLVRAMPVGRLTEEYQDQIDGWQKAQG